MEDFDSWVLSCDSWDTLESVFEEAPQSNPVLVELDLDGDEDDSVLNSLCTVSVLVLVNKELSETLLFVVFMLDSLEGVVSTDFTGDLSTEDSTVPDFSVETPIEDECGFGWAESE